MDTQQQHKEGKAINVNFQLASLWEELNEQRRLLINQPDLCDIPAYKFTLKLFNEFMCNAMDGINDIINVMQAATQTKEKTIKKIKNIVARKRGYPNWDEYYNWIAREGELSSVVAQLIESAMEEAMELYHNQPEERDAVEFFTMQQFPTQEPVETFSKTVLIYNKEDHSFCDLGYYDFETSEWAILGDMSMKLICWCYIPDASTFINGKELKEELHRGYC